MEETGKTVCVSNRTELVVFACPRFRIMPSERVSESDSQTIRAANYNLFVPTKQGKSLFDNIDARIEQYRCDPRPRHGH